MVAAVKGVKWKVGLALTVIFLAGAGIGWVTGRQALMLRQKAFSRPGVLDGLMLKRLEDRLDLTAEQKAEFEPMWKETAQRLQGQRRRAMLEQMQTVRGFYERIEPRLTEDQKAELARTRQQMRERAGGDFPPFPPKPGGPLAPGGLRPPVAPNP